MTAESSPATAASLPMSPRLRLALVPWTLALVVGFAAVIGWGGPVTSSADELQKALHPATPVTEAIARSSATTIVRLQYPDLSLLTPTVRHATDFGIDRWTVVYSRTNQLSGVRIAFSTATGEVRVTTFP